MEFVLVMYDLHTKLFINVIEGISDKDAHQRLNTKANHVAWLAGSVVSQRFEVGRKIGVDLRSATSDLFKDHWSIQDNLTYPSLSEYKKDWNLISPKLREAFADISEEQLNGPEPFGMPGEDLTLYDAIKFFTHRESYCIGQIALWRRLLGYDAMKYD